MSGSSKAASLVEQLKKIREASLVEISNLSNQITEREEKIASLKKEIEELSVQKTELETELSDVPTITESTNHLKTKPEDNDLENNASPEDKLEEESEPPVDQEEPSITEDPKPVKQRKTVHNKSKASSKPKSSNSEVPEEPVGDTVNDDLEEDADTGDVNTSVDDTESGELSTAGFEVDENEPVITKSGQSSKTVDSVENDENDVFDDVSIVESNVDFADDDDDDDDDDIML